MKLVFIPTVHLRWVGLGQVMISDMQPMAYSCLAIAANPMLVIVHALKRVPANLNSFYIRGFYLRFLTIIHSTSPFMYNSFLLFSFNMTLRQVPFVYFCKPL